jgi:Peptidase family M23
VSTNVIKRTPAAGGPSYNPGDAFHVPDHGQYGKRDRDFHVGFDYAAPAGTQIPAASSGEVVYSGPSGGFHYAVMVKSTGPDGHDYYSVYGHVDPAGALPVGTKVSIGQPIGAVGTPHPDEGERSTGPHFHFQIATEEALKGAKVPGPDGLGFSTRQTEVFKNPNEFKGWAWADKAPYNALTYVPIRDGVAYQPVPHLAQTQQAEQLFSAANSFNPPGVSPVEINRFYTETGSPSADPSGSLGNGVSRPVASPKMTVGISPAEIDRLYNFAQRDRSPTTPSTANGITPLNQTASVPWQSSPAVTSDYTPTDNFSWNNVPTGFGNRAHRRRALPAVPPLRPYVRRRKTGDQRLPMARRGLLHKETLRRRRLQHLTRPGPVLVLRSPTR